MLGRGGSFFEELYQSTDFAIIRKIQMKLKYYKSVYVSVDRSIQQCPPFLTLTWCF